MQRDLVGSVTIDETCSLSNEYYTTLLVVFRLTIMYHLII